jgi:hypothetical protein
MLVYPMSVVAATAECIYLVECTSVATAFAKKSLMQIRRLAWEANDGRRSDEDSSDLGTAATKGLFLADTNKYRASTTFRQGKVPNIIADLVLPRRMTPMLPTLLTLSSAKNPAVPTTAPPPYCGEVRLGLRADAWRVVCKPFLSLAFHSTIDKVSGVKRAPDLRATRHVSISLLRSSALA